MIHGIRPATPPPFHTFHYINGQRVEVFDTPFIRETRDLANECFNRFYRMTGRDLTSCTRNASREARNLIQTGFPAAVKDARSRGDLDLARHFAELLGEMPGGDKTFGWLNGLAFEGAGRRPAELGEQAAEVGARVA